MTQFARPPGDTEITDEETTSRISGRTNEELAAAGALRDDHGAGRAAGKRRKVLLPDIGSDPRRAQGPASGLPRAEPRGALREAARAARNWIHEIKHDGYRIQARIDGGKIRLLTRHGLDWTARFRAIADALAQLGLGSALIDGEIVVEDAAGISNLNNLQADLESRPPRPVPLLHVRSALLRGLRPHQGALLDRKDLLAQVIAGLPAEFADTLERASRDRRADHARPRLPVRPRRHRLQAQDLPYRPGRGQHWFKAKCMQQPGIRDPRLCPFDRGQAAPSARCRSATIPRRARLCRPGRHRLVRRPGGFAAQGPRQDQGAPSRRCASRCRPAPRRVSSGPQPRLVCEVILPRLDPRRPDPPRRRSRDCATTNRRRTSPWRRRRSDEDPGRCRCGRHVKLTHPERILWAEPGITKQGLADFYADIADWILPHVTGRVLEPVATP